MVCCRQCNSGSTTSCEPYDWAVNGGRQDGFEWMTAHRLLARVMCAGHVFATRRSSSAEF